MLIPLADSFNHSASVANCEVQQRDEEVLVVTTTEVKAGDELLLCYGGVAFCDLFFLCLLSQKGVFSWLFRTPRALLQRGVALQRWLYCLAERARLCAPAAEGVDGSSARSARQMSGSRHRCGRHHPIESIYIYMYCIILKYDIL